MLPQYRRNPQRERVHTAIAAVMIVSQLLIVALVGLHQHDHHATGEHQRHHEHEHGHVDVTVTSAVDHAAAECATCHLISVSRSGSDALRPVDVPGTRVCRLDHWPPAAQPPARRIITLASPRAPPMA